MRNPHSFVPSAGARRARLVCGLLATALAAVSALADWPSTNVTKYVQYPDRNFTGYDVLVGQLPGSLPLIVADDFPCRKPGPITDIHIWGSWLGDDPDPTIAITLSIWSDIPAVTNGPVVVPSRPGNLLWSETFGPGQYTIKDWASAEEQFWSPDPPPAGKILGIDHMIWQYNFYPKEPFVQQGTATKPLVYWLAVTAGPQTARFGWKTSTNHWNDDAAFGHLDPAGGPMGDWIELRDPLSAVGRSLDMSFALTTREIPPPQQQRKWAQLPDLQGGLDVNITRPNILADDFLCTSAGRITNILIWGSWRDDVQPDPNTRFVLGIWSDVPSGANNPFSHPGKLLWTETFGPGNYNLVFDGVGEERFYDPTSGGAWPESKVWRYVFSPQKPFCQRGSTNNPVVYWLSVWAQPGNPESWVGWKTSTNHWHDDAVYGHLTATGTPIGDWKDLRDPATGISLDLAFALRNGPPDADCDPTPNPPKAKWIQWPDVTPRGLDVHATFPKVVGDDFLCRRPGLINGVRIWGSWLNDKVDPNARFELAFWTDVPAVPGANKFSHPGQLLCKTLFHPPTTIGTAPMRYNFGLAAANLEERFFDPDIPGPGGFIGSDTQIWRYDFFPRLPCWFQRGTPTKPQVYWVTVSAQIAGQEPYLFGWKTSTNHWNDDGVWGHRDAAGNYLQDWKELIDPRDGKSLDLSIAIRSFPVVGINKDLKNTTQGPVDGVRIVVAGIKEITWHYDDAPPWPDFSVTYDGGNTVLQWAGKTVPPGAITHVGFELGATSLGIVSMHWLLGGVPIGVPIQVNHHLWGNGSALVLNNNIAQVPILPTRGHVEFFAEPVPLDEMNPGSQRNPIGIGELQFPTRPCLPGSAMRVPVPPPPPEARYALFVTRLADERGNEATMDFVQLPLDSLLRPALMPPVLRDSFFDVFWDTIPGRTYKLQSSPSLERPQWEDLLVGQSEDGEDMGASVPAGGSQGFLRVILVPE